MKKTHKSPVHLSDDKAIELAELFRLMGDPSRLKIVLSCLDRARCVSDMAEETTLSLSLVSHHLRLLRAAGMVRAERRGKRVFYRAADAQVRCVIIDMVAHVNKTDKAG